MECKWGILCHRTEAHADQSTTAHHIFEGLTARALPAIVPLVVMRWFVGKPGERRAGTVSIVYPSGDHYEGKSEEVLCMGVVPLSCSFHFGNIPLTEPGRYTVRLLLDQKKSYEAFFDVSLLT